MKKIVLLSALALSVALPTLRADEAVRSAQAALQSAGYYTGPVDGELSADTKAAIRRYQIRNQLEPSGDLTAETAAALNKEAANVAPPTSSAPAPVPEAPSVPAPVVPESIAPVAPPRDIYAGFFARTPYDAAPPDVKYSTLRKAQIILAERGLFRGVVDGRPGPATEEALIAFQASRQLTRTGRLDLDTLAELHLLPVAKVPIRPHRPAAPNGAVRGIPLD